MTERERAQVALLRNLLKSYFDLTRKSVKENVTKAVMCMLVNASVERMHEDLVTSLYKEELIDELLAESGAVLAQRKELEKKLAAYKEAKSVLAQTELSELDHIG